MAKPKYRKRGKRKGKIKISSRARLVEKNDAIRVQKYDTIGVKEAPTRLSGDNGANFRIKIRRKQ